MDDRGVPSVRKLGGWLTLVTRESAERFFFPLLQRGFKVNCRPGLSLKETLLQWGLGPEYIESRIETVFLNGRPVDDLESAVVMDGTTLALSAAMPGLVGATMRRRGVFSSFRSSISHPQIQDQTASLEGLITVKLFNLLMGELGPVFLKLGVLIERRVLETCLTERAQDLEKVTLSVRVDDKEVELAKVLQNESLDDHGFIRFRVFQKS